METTRRTFISTALALLCGLFYRERPGMRWLREHGKRPRESKAKGFATTYHWDVVEYGDKRDVHVLPQEVLVQLNAANKDVWDTEDAAMEAAAIAVEKGGVL